MKNYFNEKTKSCSPIQLGRDFFDRHTVDVAPDLLGKILVFGKHKGIITETEAYRGDDDPASHAFKGVTPRTRGMFGAPGFSYIYLIYGMYHCLNVTTESENMPGAVLIRGLWVEEEHLTGPGKLCRHLQLNLQHNGVDLIRNSDFYLADYGITLPFKTTSRIGIKVGGDKLWRFVASVN
ncbi:MAG: DNA-3-methyladenine glycosylase [Gammaproteobacteria bacterium]|nr:DNA-3-methyladenine glycosylase [Gammaproteobacteria bacterium]